MRTPPSKAGKLTSIGKGAAKGFKPKAAKPTRVKGQGKEKIKKFFANIKEALEVAKEHRQAKAAARKAERENNPKRLERLKKKEERKKKKFLKYVEAVDNNRPAIPVEETKHLDKAAESIKKIPDITTGQKVDAALTTVEKALQEHEIEFPDLTPKNESEKNGILIILVALLFGFIIFK